MDIEAFLVCDAASDQLGKLNVLGASVLRWFAQYQPFTPVNETIRGLLMGTRIGNDGIITIVWCVAVAGLSYVWARRKYDRKPVQA